MDMISRLRKILELIRADIDDERTREPSQYWKGQLDLLYSIETVLDELAKQENQNE